MSWRGRSLRDLAAIISLTAATTIEAGMKANQSWDDTFRGKGIKVTQEKNDTSDFRRDSFQGGRNYTLPARPEANDDVIVS